MSLLEQFLVQNVFVFMLVFVRIGTAFTIMPGVGDNFVPQNIRLLTALAFSVVLTPVLLPYMPQQVPPPFALAVLIGIEFVTGLFIGTIARVLISALDTAGMVISLQSGLGNAQVFNPNLSTQGSVVGAFLSVTGSTLMMSANLHHLVIRGLVNSYEAFPVADLPDVGGMAQLMAKMVSTAFAMGVQLAAPFLILGMLVFVGMGVLARLMPQIQVFILVLPMQVLLALIAMSFTISVMMMAWANQFREGMAFFLTTIGG